MSRIKKIVLMTDSLGAGGAQRQMVGLAGMLSQKNYEIEVCTYFDQDFYKHNLDEQCINNVLLKDGSNRLYRIPTIYKYLKGKKPDLVIAYQETPSLIACVCKLLGCKYKLIVSERNTTQRIRLVDRIRFFMYRVADVIVPNSYAQTNFLTVRYKWMNRKIRTIINFVDMETYCPVEHTLRPIPLITIAASVWPPKNTLGLLKACKILNERKLQFQIEWYGLVEVGAEYAEACLNYIRENKLTNVKLLPKEKRIVEKYQNTDYFCLPSFFEGTPNVICEAMSCGKPVVCSDVCDNSRYVVNNINGFLFDPDRPVDIADKIQKMLLLPHETYIEMSINSRAIAEKNFSKERFFSEYESIINKL